jgi:hypothetical protein
MNLFFRFFKRASVVIFTGAVFLVLSSFVSSCPATNGLTIAFAQSPEQPAIENLCSEQPKLRSREANAPAKIRFINPTDGTYVLQWIDYNGALKEYGTLGPGAEITQDTFLTHPWIVAYGEGSCRQIFLPAEGISVARVLPESELSRKKATAAPCKSGEHVMNGQCTRPKQQSNQCGRDEVYSSSMGQCIPKSLGR